MRVEAKVLAVAVDNVNRCIQQQTGTGLAARSADGPDRGAAGICLQHLHVASQKHAEVTDAVASIGFVFRVETAARAYGIANRCREAHGEVSMYLESPPEPWMPPGQTDLWLCWHGTLEFYLDAGILTGLDRPPQLKHCQLLAVLTRSRVEVGSFAVHGHALEGSVARPGQRQPGQRNA